MQTYIFAVYSDPIPTSEHPAEHHHSLLTINTSSTEHVEVQTYMYAVLTLPVTSEHPNTEHQTPNTFILHSLSIPVPTENVEVWTYIYALCMGA